MTKRLWLGLLALLCVAITREARAVEVQRIAVVVGANMAPPGRSPLRYAHEDAKRVAEVLISVGGFAKQNVKLAFDPAPDALLALLDQALAEAGKRGGETLLFFYYSGHADERSIFPRGEILAFSALKQRLEDPRAKLRVGLLDSCRGGSWTGSKGLKKVEPFEIEAARGLAEEGSVLIASSAGQENAHETETLGGSFFTHYWNAGLRGAADRGGDGVVTLNEAFEYARSLTIRDTALAGQSPQHPSFQMKLAGRRDFPLATLARERTTLVFEQETGPVELVRLSDGLVVIESTPGARSLRLGLPAGSYLVRRRSNDGVLARVVSLSSGGTVHLKESELTPSGMQAGRTKGDAAGGASKNSWLGQRFYASVAAGVRHAPIIDPGLRAGAADGDGVFLLRASVRLARRLWLTAPLALAFDAERETRFNWFLWGGAPVLGVTHADKLGVTLASFVGLGADARLRQSQGLTFNGSLAALGALSWSRASFQGPTTWTTQLTLGLSATIPGAASFNVGMGFGLNPLSEGQLGGAAFDSVERNVTLAFGSVQRTGLRPLPLIHVPVTDAWAVDAHAVVAYRPALKGWVETYTAGLSYAH
ncbi:MAG TPA: caspase family protein [Polyangiaceae bacterium]|nr:caspase family protein [Polyangiaceae bacterium]